MLFTSRSAKTEIITRKKTIEDKNGKPALYVNIAYPALQNAKGAFADAFNRFYGRSAEAFYNFATVSLAEKAKIMAARDDFSPMAAVMKSRVTHEGKLTLSVSTEAFIYDGLHENARTRSAQVWEKKRGVLLTWHDVFTPAARDAFALRFASDCGITSKALSKLLTNEKFYFTPDGVCLLLPVREGMPETLFAEKEFCAGKNLLKIRF